MINFLISLQKKRGKTHYYLLRTLLAAATRSYVLASSYMILTRNWPSISSWASLLKTKWSHLSWASANVTVQVNSQRRLLLILPLLVAAFPVAYHTRRLNKEMFGSTLSLKENKCRILIFILTVIFYLYIFLLALNCLNIFNEALIRSV